VLSRSLFLLLPCARPRSSPSVCHTASWLLCWLVQTGVLLVTWSHGWVVEERWSVVEQIEQRAAAGSAVVSAQHTEYIVHALIAPRALCLSLCACVRLGSAYWCEGNIENYWYIGGRVVAFEKLETFRTSPQLPRRA